MCRRPREVRSGLGSDVCRRVRRYRDGEREATVADRRPRRSRIATRNLLGPEAIEVSTPDSEQWKATDKPVRNASAIGATEGTLSLKVKFVENEKVLVPVGEFDAYELEMQGSYRNNRAAGAGYNSTHWYAPTARSALPLRDCFPETTQSSATDRHHQIAERSRSWCHWSLFGANRPSDELMTPPRRTVDYATRRRQRQHFRDRGPELTLGYDDHKPASSLRLGSGAKVKV
jgi:hypothetical protein